MALTPEDIEQHIFKVSRRGYDKVEVDRFLGEVARSYRDLRHQLDRTVLATTEPTPPADPPAPDPGPSAGPTEDGGALFRLDRGPEPPPAAPGGPDDFQRLGSEVAEVLRTAHASVAQLRHEAEVEASVLRQRAEREVAELRREAEVQAARIRQEAQRDAAALRGDAQRYAEGLRNEADEYAARTHVDTDRDVAEKAAAAQAALDDAERRLAEARIAADAVVAEAEARADAVVRDAELDIAQRRQELEAEAEAEAAAAAERRDALLAEATRRLDAARDTEEALRRRLVAARGDLGATLARFPEVQAPAEPAPGPVVDLSDEAPDIVLDLTELDDEAGDEPPVPPGWPGAPPLQGRVHDLFGDQDLEPVAPSVLATDDPPAPEAPIAPEDVDGPLSDIVRDAIGRAVRNAVDRDDAGD
ncbi:MAG: DivIVA domain-containing protein [Acidimicrobiales bacterium]|nr:DivIVA domain-containing protein [Acidimicrobiales bacterium]